MPLRGGREQYAAKYEEALRLHAAGKSIRTIAAELGVSYSAAYHWIKGLRAPAPGQINEFIAMLRAEGPQSGLALAKRFPKHNELFLMASRRGLPVRRVWLGKVYKDLATWYYMEGQEAALETKVAGLFASVAEARQRLKEILFT